MVELHALHTYTMIWEKEVLASPPPPALSPSLSLPFARYIVFNMQLEPKGRLTLKAPGASPFYLPPSPFSMKFGARYCVTLEIWYLLLHYHEHRITMYMKYRITALSVQPEVAGCWHE